MDVWGQKASSSLHENLVINRVGMNWKWPQLQQRLVWGDIKLISWSMLVADTLRNISSYLYLKNSDGSFKTKIVHLENPKDVLFILLHVFLKCLHIFTSIDSRDPVKWRDFHPDVQPWELDDETGLTDMNRDVLPLLNLKSSSRVTSRGSWRFYASNTMLNYTCLYVSHGTRPVV